MEEKFLNFKRKLITSFNMMVSSLLITLLIISTTVPTNHATAASKEYDSYKKIKPGMTLTAFAKVVYGKKYQDYLKKDNGITVLKAELDYRDVQDTYAQYYYSFFEFYDKTVEYHRFKMYITFSTKENGKTLYVVSRGYTAFKKSSEHLYKGAKLKKGMSIEKVNKLISGKEMPQWYLRYQSDYTVLNMNKAFLPSPEQEDTIRYYVKNYNKSKNCELIFNFDAKQQKYLLRFFQ